MGKESVDRLEYIKAKEDIKSYSEAIRRCIAGYYNSEYFTKYSSRDPLKEFFKPEVESLEKKDDLKDVLKQKKEERELKKLFMASLREKTNEELCGILQKVYLKDPAGPYCEWSQMAGAYDCFYNSKSKESFDLGRKVNLNKDDIISKLENAAKEANVELKKFLEGLA